MSIENEKVNETESILDAETEVEATTQITTADEAPQEEIEAAPAVEEEKPRKKAAAKKAMVPNEDAIEASPAVVEENGDDATELAMLRLMSQSKKRRSAPNAKPGHFAPRPNGTIHSIDGGARVMNPALAEKRKAEISLYQSFVNKRILKGQVLGVKHEFDRAIDGKLHYYVMVKHGPYQVIIPLEKFTTTNMEDLLAMYQTRDPEKTMEDAMKIYLNSRLNAEIDYVVTNIDTEGGLDASMTVGGDRNEAMQRNRIHFWYGTTTDGQPLIKVGDKAQARVIAVSRKGIRIEIFGVESFVPYRELSWVMVDDAHTEFNVGEKVTVVITSIDRALDKDYAVSYSASVKQALPDPRDEGMKMFTPNGVYMGTITYIRVPTEQNPNARPAVFVELMEGVQCMCRFPLGSVPPQRGAKAAVTIIAQEQEKKYLYGNINHIYPLDNGQDY